MHSYYDFYYVSGLPFHHIARLTRKAFEKKEEKKAWDMWVPLYLIKEQETFVPFSEFYEDLKAPKIEITHETVDQTFQRFKSRIKKPMKEGE